MLKKKKNSHNWPIKQIEITAQLTLQINKIANQVIILLEELMGFFLCFIKAVGTSEAIYETCAIVHRMRAGSEKHVFQKI